VKADPTTLTGAIKSGKAPQLLLVFGDELLVQEVCDSILDQLVPKEQRGFNLERFDGRTANWDEIDASINTPPFYQGKKLLWVENAPYFFSREQKAELGKKIVAHWRDGKPDDAVKLLIDLLVLEGWSPEDSDRFDGLSIRLLSDLLEVDDDNAQGEVEALLAYCKTHNLELGKRKRGGEHRLFTLIDEGLPAWSFLLMTATQVDRRTRLYKRFEEIGAALYVSLERDRTGKADRQQLLDFVAEELRRAGKNLDLYAREMVLAMAGDDLRRLRQELAKLSLFVGERRQIRAEDVDAIFTDHGEGWIFDLTRAIADRDAKRALTQLARLIAQGEHPLKIMGTVAAEVRRLLSARQFLETDLAGVWMRDLTYQQFQQNVLRDGKPLLTRNPYADYMCFQRAEHFSLNELRIGMERLFEADLRLKSTGGHSHLVLERWILFMCLDVQRERLPGDARAPT
jgi:DNA polymerase-3 subunit delta